jgi:hypothetical protein
MGAGNISYERQIYNSYLEGFTKWLVQKDIHFKIRNQYLKLFKKVITTKNITTTYRNLKITQLKVILDDYAKRNGIDFEID